MPMYQRPPFWRMPTTRQDPDFEVVRTDSRTRSRPLAQPNVPHYHVNCDKPAMGRVHTFTVTLRREHRDTNWGLRLVGGSDLATPLIVTRVTPGTPAGRELLRGDIIAKIDDYDARDLRHEDAQNLFKNAANQIKIVVQRGGPSPHHHPGPPILGRYSGRVPTHNYYHNYYGYGYFREGGSSSHLYSVPHASGSYVGRVPTPTFYHEYGEDVDREAPRGATQAPRSPIPAAVAPISYRTPSPLPHAPPAPWQGKGPESLPRTPIPAQAPQYDYYRTDLLSPSSIRTDETLDESINSQPYRTTPLVLPGAKVRREPGPTESYLRHHPNPSMRAPPHHDYRDTLMRQKLPQQLALNMVHKQFNSPINLYSEQNIANSIRQQSSPLPHKPTLLYDPAKSETFRMLQEEGLGDVVQEVPTPVQTKVFTAPPVKRHAPTPKPKPQPDATLTGKKTSFVNSLHEEHIQQSNSFKRLMYNVLGDTEY